MGWKCFLTTPSPYMRRSLRRYSGNECPVNGYHNFEIVIDDQLPADQHEEGGSLPDEYEGDPRWPTHCPCNYRFHPEDHFQVNVDRLYEGSPDGELYVLKNLPVGAMWDAHWLAGVGDRYVGPDGKAWCVMMPCRVEWIVYGPSSDGSKWDVQGSPPNITVSPSIRINNNAYHGYIRDGIISEDVDGRAIVDIPRTA